MNSSQLYDIIAPKLKLGYTKKIKLISDESIETIITSDDVISVENNDILIINHKNGQTELILKPESINKIKIY